MKMRKFWGKYDRILILLLMLVFCLIVLMVVMASSGDTETPYLGAVLEDGMVGSQNQRLFARKNGGFVLVSEEDGTPVVVEMNQSGMIVSRFSNVPEPEDKGELEIPYPAFQRGQNLFVTDFFLQNDESADGRYSLAIVNLEGDPNRWQENLSYWQVPSQEVDFYQEPISLTADSQGKFYYVNPANNSPDFGKVYRFDVNDLDDSRLMKREVISLGDRWIQRIVSAPDDGLYLCGHDFTDFPNEKSAVWWMDPDHPELSPIMIASGPLESLDSLVFPVDFVGDRVAVGSDGNLYRIEEDHKLSRLDWKTPENGLEAVVSQSDDDTILVKSRNNEIKKYSLSHPSQLGEVVFEGQDGEIIAFASNSDDTMILLLYPDIGYTRVLLSELDAPPPEVPSSSSDTTAVSSEESKPSSQPSQIPSRPAGEDSEVNPPPSSSPDSGPEKTVPKEIVSDTFLLSEDGYLKVDLGTTWAKLRNTIEAGSGRLEMRRADGRVFTSGKVGTGMSVVLYDTENKVVDTVTIMVPGDMNGSGTVNTQDERMLYEYLLGERDLNGVYWSAADYYADGTVNLLDLINLKRHLK